MKTHPLHQLRSWLSLFVVLLGLAPLASAQTYYNLAAGDFTENFSTVSTWTAPSTGSWLGLALNSTGAIPDGVKITHASTAFVTGSSGGAQKGTNDFALLATGSTDNANATAVDLALNFSGRNVGTLSFKASSVANSTGNRGSSLRVYASTDGTAWTEVTGTGLPFVAVNNVTSSANISVTLPAALNNQSQARLRFYCYNGTTPAISGASGSRPKISIDDVTVTSTSAIAGLPVIGGTLTGSVQANVEYSYTIIASDSPTSYDASPLPVGLSINKATGVISGTPTVPGTYNITLSATNASGTGQAILVLTVTVDPGAATVNSGQSITGVINTEITPYQVLAGNSPTSYAASGLPTGLVIDTVTGVISGTPTVAGSFNVTVTATNALGTGSATLTITVNSPPIITSDLSGSAYAGVAFTYTLTATTAQGLSSVAWSNLPAGFTVSGTTSNIISGTPVAGDYTIGIAATNGTGTTNTTFTLKVIEQTTQDAIPLNVVINKYANGSSDGLTPDRIELLVIGSGVGGSSVDMRGMIIKDFSSSMVGEGGGKYQFSQNSLWSAVPAGTLIVLSAGNTEAEDLNVADFVLRTNLGNSALFNYLSGSFDIATTEMILLKAAGYGAYGSAGGIHVLAGGTAGAQLNAYTGAKLTATGTSGASIGVMATNSTSTLADYKGTGATGNVAVASLTFGAGNNATNQAYIDLLRTPVVTHTALETWRFQQFGVYTDTTDVLAGDTEDFDGDGIPNLLEYATGSDPTVANASLVTLGKSGDFLTLSFPVISDGSITYRVQASDDLTGGFTTATGSVSDASGIRTYTDTVSLSTAGVRRFLRLQVTYGE